MPFQSEDTCMETFRFNLYIIGYDKDRKKLLIERLLAHHKDKGQIWARELLKAIRQGEKPIIHQSNAAGDINQVARNLHLAGAELEVEDLYPDEEDDE
jgi:hypothetical protein